VNARPALRLASDPAGDAAGGSWLEVLRSAVRPEFRVEVYRPPAGTALAGAVCAIPGCDKLAHRRPLGPQERVWLCGAHARRWEQAGAPVPIDRWARSQAPVFSFMDVRACAVPGCSRSQDANGMCGAHQRRCRSAGRPPLERFHARAEPAAPTGRPCAFPGCEFPATPRSQLCDGHRVKFRRFRHYRRSEATIPDFVAHVEAQRGNDTARFDLSGLPETLTMELQFALQCRHDEAGATFTPGRWAGVVEVLRTHGVESLLGHEPGFWRELDPTWKPGNRRFGYIRYALKVLRRLGASGLGLDPWEPDLWDVRGLPIGDSYRHQRVSWIDWRGVEPAWLRALAKRWARQRLLTGSRSPATIHSAAK